jgi:diguanylate cyclase (GGDEF)-like protein/PAS domain S-box-containing protein
MVLLRLKDIEVFLDCLGDAALIVDQESNILFANKACQCLFKYTEKDFMTIKVEQLIGLNNVREQHNKHMREYISGQHPSKKILMSSPAVLVRDAIPCVRSDGSLFKARISVSSIAAGSIPYGVAIINDYSGVFDLICQLNNDAITDKLTGLLNDRFLSEWLDNRVGVDAKFGVAYCDLAKFKLVNDGYGHKHGDEVLKEFSIRLRKTLTPKDKAIRIGGDEFIVLYELDQSKDSREEMKDKADILCNVVKAPFYLTDARKSIELGMSIGLGVYPNDHSELNTLFDMCDQAMYECKTRGIPYLFVNG